MVLDCLAEVAEQFFWLSVSTSSGQNSIPGPESLPVVNGAFPELILCLRNVDFLLKTLIFCSILCQFAKLDINKCKIYKE